MSEHQTKEKACKCTMHQSMVGDGCEVRNPSLALEYAKDQLAELKQDLARYESSRAVLTLLNDTQRDKIRGAGSGARQVQAIPRPAQARDVPARHALPGARRYIEECHSIARRSGQGAEGGAVVTNTKLTDQQRREQLAKSLADWNHWQALAAQKGWKLPGNSPLPRESWINYWQQCAAYERDPSSGRPVVPHRSGR